MFFFCTVLQLFALVFSFGDQVLSPGSSLATDFLGVVPLWRVAQRKFFQPCPDRSIKMLLRQWTLLEVILSSGSKEKYVYWYWLVFVLFLTFDLTKAGATQTERSLSRQPDAGDCGYLLDVGILFFVNMKQEESNFLN